MKIIRTVNGLNRFEYQNEKELYANIRSILSRHRATLIKHLLSDLENYVFYKFQVKANDTQLDRIKDSLEGVKNSPVSDVDYFDLYQKCANNTFTYITTTRFYNELDKSIEPIIAGNNTEAKQAF
jgi:hypothetical protein